MNTEYLLSAAFSFHIKVQVPRQDSFCYSTSCPGVLYITNVCLEAPTRISVLHSYLLRYPILSCDSFDGDFSRLQGT